MNHRKPTTDKLAMIALISPQGEGTIYSAWFSMSEIQKLAALISAGVIGGGGSVLVTIEQAKADAAGDADGGTAKVIPGLEDLEVTADKVGAIDLFDTDLDFDNDFEFARVKIVADGGATTRVSGMILGAGDSAKRYGAYGEGFENVFGRTLGTAR